MGAQLAQAVAQTEYQVAEAPRMNARVNRRMGKSDSLDARRIAQAALSLETTHLPNPHDDDGERAALCTLVTAREHRTTERTSTINALNALLRTIAPGIDARSPLTTMHITEIARCRTRAKTLPTATARAETIRLAKPVMALMTNSPRTGPVWKRSCTPPQHNSAWRARHRRRHGRDRDGQPPHRSAPLRGRVRVSGRPHPNNPTECPKSNQTPTSLDRTTPPRVPGPLWWLTGAPTSSSASGIYTINKQQPCVENGNQLTSSTASERLMATQTRSTKD